MNSMSYATCFAIVWGFSAGLQQISLQYIMPHYYGTKCIGTINSIGATSGVIGSAIGPITYGVAIDKIGSWATILWWTVPLALGSTLLLICMGKKPTKPHLQDLQVV